MDLYASEGAAPTGIARPNHALIRSVRDISNYAKKTVARYGVFAGTWAGQTACETPLEAL